MGNHLRVLREQGNLTPGVLEHYTMLCQLVDLFQDEQGQFDQEQQVPGHIRLVWRTMVLLVDIWNLEIYEARPRRAAGLPSE